jgi:hypothetical protein
MSVKVPDDVLKMTTKCPHTFSCLTLGQCGERKMCEVEHINGTNLLFLKDKQQAVCSYRLTYANSQICICPTHYAIQHMKR